MRKTICALALAAVCASAVAGPGFKVKPSVTPTSGGAAKISFEVAEPTDVEVAVLDAKGAVVRHLAAGVLGPKAPAPFKKGSLSQTVVWDGKDDLGKPVAAASVRVSLGMTPAFDRLIGDNPGGLASVKSLAVAPDGTLYVYHAFGDIHPGDLTTVCVAFDRKGNYLRQVMPYPANLPEEKLKGFRRLDVEGKKIPFIYQAETRSLVPGLGTLPGHVSVAASDGRVAFVGHQEWVGTTTRYNQKGVQQIVVLNGDGSTSEGSVLRTVLAKGSGGGISLALSPDEKTIYATGAAQGSGKRAKVAQVVYKFGWTDPKPTVFAGELGKAGEGKLLNSPRSVAVDKNGNVYVADRNNNRVAVFKPDGSLLGEIKGIDAVWQVAVSRKTGAVYTLGGTYCEQLKKFASWKAAKPAVETGVPYYKAPKKNYRALMAVDDSAEPVLVYIAPQTQWIKFKLMRIEDKGGSFGKPVDLAKLPGNSKPNAGPRTRYKIRTGGSISGMALDSRNDILYVNRRKVDLKTGKWSESGTLAADGTKNGVGSFGLDGKLYSQSYPNRLLRLGADLKPVAFPNEKEPGIFRHPGRYRLRGRGVTADPAGNIYVLRQKSKAETKKGDASDANSLFVYAPDGTLKKVLIDSEIRPINSVRLDYQGNIYVGLGVRPAGKGVPAAFKGLALGKPWKYSMNTLDLNWYTPMYGCIVKFGPDGGAVRTGSGGVKVAYSYNKKTEVKGAQWMFYGASPMPSWRIRFPDACLCESPRFDVDGYGRSFFPDAGRFRCGVLDTAGNLIAWFGAYGNQDSAGPDSKVATPAIGFYWPYHICVDDGMVYVADRLNRRVVAVKLTYAAQETCPIR
jgi:NHL repeat-containing protein